MTRRYYSSTAEPATLVSGVNSSAVNITVSTVAGWPVSYPYTIVVDIDTVDEEIMDVTSASGTVLTVTRGVAGSAAVDHLAGANIRHAVDGRDFNDFSSHVDATSDVHGVTGPLVSATAAQTLTNKTLLSPIIDFIRNGPATLALPTTGTALASADGNDTLESKTLNDPTVNGGSADFDALAVDGSPVATRDGAEVLTNKTMVGFINTGTITNNGSIVSGTVNPDTLMQGGVGVVTTSGTQTLTNKTMVGAALDSTSTFDGSRIARRLFAPVWSILTSSTAVIGAGDLVEIASVQVTGANAVDVEAVFSFSMAFLTGTNTAYIQIWANGSMKQNYKVTGANASGGTVRAVFAGNADPMTVSVKVTPAIGSTAQIYADSGAQMALSVRQMNL